MSNFPRQLVFQDIRYAEDDLGNTNANQDYSADETFFRYRSADVNLEVHNILYYFEANSAIISTGYGNIVAGLINGISFGVYNTKTQKELFTLTAEPILLNSDWLQRTVATGPVFSFTLPNTVFAASICFTNKGGPILLRAREEEIRISLNDNFTTFVEHTFLVQSLIR